MRLFVLRTLSSQPKSGYDILKEIGEKTHGEWCPSKGTIYPILSELEKEELIEVEGVFIFVGVEPNTEFLR